MFAGGKREREREYGAQRIIYIRRDEPVISYYKRNLSSVMTFNKSDESCWTDEYA